MRANDSNVVARKYSHIGQFVTKKMKGETFAFNLRLIKFYFETTVETSFTQNVCFVYINMIKQLKLKIKSYSHRFDPSYAMIQCCNVV